MPGYCDTLDPVPEPRLEPRPEYETGVLST